MNKIANLETQIIFWREHIFSEEKKKLKTFVNDKCPLHLIKTMSSSNNCEFTSIYIANTCGESAQRISRLFSVRGIGKVHRVDLFASAKNPAIMSAFVHLDYWFETDLAYKIYNLILANGECCYYYDDHSMFYDNYGPNGEFYDVEPYFILRRMTAQYVEDTHKNIHQIADESARTYDIVEQMDITIGEQATRINQLEDMVYRLSSRLDALESSASDKPMKVEELSCEPLDKVKGDVDRIQDTIYQLLGVIFDQETESAEIFRNHNYMMHGIHYEKGWLKPDGTPYPVEEPEAEEMTSDTDEDEDMTSDTDDDDEWVKAGSTLSTGTEKIDSLFTADCCDDMQEEQERVAFSGMLNKRITELLDIGYWKSFQDVESAQQRYINMAWELFDETQPACHKSTDDELLAVLNRVALKR
jgi:hypothetical protein